MTNTVGRALMPALKNFGLFAAAGLFAFSTASAQVKGTKYTFKDIKRLDATPAKNQCHTGTCWCFSTSSFIESELMRTGKGEYDLSEMYTVRKVYEEKAKKYVATHGKINWGQGGEFHDVMRIYKEYGAMPQEAYPGKPDADGQFREFELEAVLKGMLDAVIKNTDNHVSNHWMDAVNGVLDAYLGKVPEKFTYKGKEYTPKIFAESLGINPDDYIEVTSTTDHPYYTPFISEVEDNWHWDPIQNVTVEDMKEILDNSIDKGYTVAWGADVSDPGFNYRKGIAILPAVDWDTVARDARDSFISNPMKQMTVTQAARQENLDNFKTQDDHGMQITGTAEDQLGDRFYIVKNSWGTKLNDYKGFFYASQSYVLMNTTGLMVNKKALPKNIAKKLGV
jgi:bleomycin hydrolase